jgi:phosphomannomutase
MSELIISVSGLRGIVGESLTPEIAARFALAFAAELPDGSIVITRDGRESGSLLAATVSAALVATGRDVLDGGIAATPTTGVLVREHGDGGGIQISASHNPAPYNGLKLFSGEGRVIPACLGEQVVQRFNQTKQTPSVSSRNGITKLVDTTSAHLRLIERTIDVERIRTQRFRVLLDSNHGAGSILGRELLEFLGCDVTLLGAPPDGRFENLPEPTAENLASVCPRVRQLGAAIGFCQDPDADRLAIIDERGKYIGEEYTLALCVDHVLRQTPGPVVTNCSTSRMSQDLAVKYGVPFFRSAVGEANVVDAMLAQGAVIGGEGNGGAIDPRVGLVRDSFVGMALVLDTMASRGLPVSALAAELPKYAIHKTKVTLSREQVATAFDALEQHFADATPDRLDGLRLDWPDRWLLVRASNTEPIVRIIAEAPDAATAKDLCDRAEAVLA